MCDLLTAGLPRSIERFKLNLSFLPDERTSEFEQKFVQKFSPEIPLRRNVK